MGLFDFSKKKIEYDENYIEKPHFDENPKYIIRCSYDTKVCPKCEEMDGKIFYYKDIVVGVTCPPFHDGCRCYAWEYHDFVDYKKLKMRVRNPHTNQYEIVKHMSYKEWKKKYKL